MTDSIDFDSGLGRKELVKIKHRFNALHQQRLKRLEDELSEQQKDFLKLVPLLFHINHSALPGYLSNDVPAGLADYQPDRQTLLVAKKYSRTFEFSRRALRIIPIEGLFLMGSIGTIGQTIDSDLDFWLCHSHSLSDDERTLLQQKADLIEKDAMNYGLEVHFFLMDAVAFKAGRKLTISTESSGSTQHHLLLEEFYRTGILLAGRPPMWWLVPVAHEQDYNAYTRWLIDKRFIDSCDFVDFGGMQNVPPNEFFGAAHWQLYKGIESPYKSILKILLMESYASGFPDIPWLSLITKKAVYDGNEDVIDIDPYILIYRLVESYLISRGQDVRLELARRCFYFKVNLPLSRTRRASTHWKYIKLRSLVNEWGWTDNYIARLDARDHWKIEEVLHERNILVRELTQSYRVLMNFARNNAATGGINPAELNLLGRKLYAALEKRPGKIDFINPGISRDLLEHEVCFHLDHQNSQIRWSLYRQPPDKQSDIPALKTTSSLLELIAWCYCNGIINRHVQIVLRPDDCPVSIAEIRHLIELVSQAVTTHKKNNIEIAELGKKAFSIFSTAFINVGIDPLMKFSRAGLQLTSSQSDALSYSTSHINLAQSIDILSVNTWGEIEVHSNYGSDGLLESLCRFLQSMTQLKKPYYQKSHGFGSSRSQSIGQRIDSLIKSLVDCFFKSPAALNTRYLLKVDKRIASIYYSKGHFSFLLFDSNHDLYEYLSNYNEEFVPVVFDSLAMSEHPLPAIFKHNHPDTIQLFSWKLESGAQLFILDESGSLFYQFVKNADPAHLLIQQQRFLKSLFDRQALLSTDTAARLLYHQPEFFHVEKGRNQQWKALKAQLPIAPVVDDYVDLQLIVGSDPDTLTSYSVICGEREFDYLILGNEIYTDVARHILSMRKDAATYPVYLTSIAPTADMGDNSSWSTIRLMNFKKRLESQFNIALETLAAAQR